MLIDYSVTKTFDQTIDVVDIGNTCLHCFGDAGDEYYIITKTIMGQFYMLSFGPVLDGATDILCPNFTTNYIKMEYKEKKILKLISSYVNDPGKKIQEIVESTEYEGMQQFPNIADAFNNA